MITNYQAEAKEALVKCEASMTIKLSNTKLPNWDKAHNDQHNHYRVTIKSKHGQYTFDFFGSKQAYLNGEHITEYDVISCFNFHIPESFDDFISDFGYEINSKESYEQTMRTWKDCLKMAKNLKRIFPSESQQVLLLEIN